MMPPPAEERRFVSFDGTEIAYRSFGEGRPILLCNGLGGGWEAWSHQIQSFRARYRLLCWDYRGLYGSGAPPEPGELTVPAQAQDALRLLDEVGVERAAVVGWSVGAQVALELFRTAPDRVASLALLNGVAGRPWDYVFNLSLVGRVLPPFLRGLRSMPRTIQTLLTQVARLPNPGEWAIRTGLAASTLDVQLAAELVSNLRSADTDVFIRMLECMGQHDAWDLLPLIDVPTLVMAGSRDVFTPRSAAERMARRIPGAEVMLIPGATHYAALEYPEMVNMRLDKFLRERGYEPRPTGAS